MALMEAIERFASLLQRPEASVPLDEVSFLIAADAHPGLDVDAQLARLDALAARCPMHTRAGVLTHLFRDEGFHGNEADYYDPENSMLDSVLDRRMGIPISLSVVLIEVARRLGVTLVGVSAPAHFIVRDESDGTYFDPFAGGRPLDLQDRVRRYGLAPLDPVGTYAIVARMLGNLKGIYVQRGDAESLRWVMRLRVLVPGVPAAERQELARLMAPMN